jgi:glycosyltransferase involved in cell wall biosynthesis
MSERKTVKTLNRKRYDLLHLTGEDIGYLEHVRNRKPVVVTVHDLIPELYPDYFYNPEKILKERTAAFAKADVLICVSESTRNDLMKIYGINKEKTKVIYHGDPAYLIENPNTRDFLNPLNNKKYLLYIGSRASPYKNFIKMVTELTPFFRKNKDVFLLCIGERLSSEESAMFQTLDVKNRIFSAAIPDNALFLVYKHALCLVYPSLYEGFGFPVLEAMKAGCPILCSNSSSIPEVAQNGSLYFDPVNFHGFNENLNIILNDIHHIEMLRNNQKHILSKFSWQNAAIQTHQAYLSLI